MTPAPPGRLEERELVLDSEAKVKTARDLLVAAGAQAPRILGQVEAHDIHHGVAPGRFATSACQSCHDRASRLDENFVLSESVPFGVTAAWVGDGNLAPVPMVRDERGRLVVKPTLAGLHVFGHSGNRIIDTLGLLAVLGTLAGAGGHALLRVRSSICATRRPSINSTWPTPNGCRMCTRHAPCPTRPSRC